MMIDEGVQTNFEMQRKAFENRVLKEGMHLLHKQKEFARQKKLKEQKEMRDMLERYWPWNRAEDAQPRGLRNLRLEELFPNNDYKNAQRFVGTLDLGRGGGGAPVIRYGRRVIKTKEDPMLRFQFGSKDLRRCVDNTLRYKTDKSTQLEYKKELDKLVNEKKKKEQEEKSETKQFHREQGWSNEQTLKKLENEFPKHTLVENKHHTNFKKFTVVPPAKMIKNNPVAPLGQDFITKRSPRKLNPLSNNKEEGLELVALLAKDRKHPPKIPLTSSDVTSEKKMGKITIWNRQGSAYLRELAQQMLVKKEQMKEMKAKETESAQLHFTTWESFWGRPGNGAPLPEIKKQCLDRMLYPKMPPISVH